MQTMFHELCSNQNEQVDLNINKNKIENIEIEIEHVEVRGFNFKIATSRKTELAVLDFACCFE